MGDELSDAELVARALTREESAVDALIVRYQPVVSAYTAQLLENIPEAEDVAQEVFLRAFQELTTLREPARYAAWLKSIAWRECRAWVRRQQAMRKALRQKAADTPRLALFEIECEDEPREDPWLTRLEQTLEDLNAGNKTVLALFYLRGMSHDRISGFLDIPVGTVKRRLFDARQALAASAESIDEADHAERRRFVAAIKRLLSSDSGKEKRR